MTLSVGAAADRRGDADAFDSLGPVSETSPRRGRPRPPGTFRVGTVGGTDVLVSSSWLVVAVLIAVAIAPHAEQVTPGLGAWKYAVGVVVAVTLYLAILLHEASHVVVVRHFGHQVPSITLSFMGGRTAVQGEPRSPGQEFLAAVVGPLASLAVGALAYAAYVVTPQGVAYVVIEALAFSNLLLGVMNLAPVLPLDGGRVLKALVWQLTGSSVRGIQVAAWAGRVVGVAVVAYAVLVAPVIGHPLRNVDLVFAGIIGVYLWSASTSELAGARLRSRFAGVVPRELARRTLAVPADLPLAEALRRAREASAGAIVTVDAHGVPVGLVHEAALQAVPAERRPWVPTATVTRTVHEGLRLPASISGDQLLLAINEDPAPEYLLVELDGGLLGVLALSDLDRAVGLGPAYR